MSFVFHNAFAGAKKKKMSAIFHVFIVGISKVFFVIGTSNVIFVIDFFYLYFDLFLKS